MALAATARPQAPGSPVFTNFAPEQYRGHFQNWSAVQDARGVLFIANSSGILEYDGRTWRTTYGPDQGIVRSLTRAKDGTIYFGGTGDFGYLAADAKGTLRAVSLKSLVPEGHRAFNEVWQMLATPHGVYALTRARIFRLERDRVHPLPARAASH